MALGGGLFPGMRRALLYHVGVAGFAAFIVVAAVAGTTRVYGVENGNIHMYNTQIPCVDLRLQS